MSGAGILNNAGRVQDRPNDLMTPADHYSDALLRFENFERYTAQSQATVDGQRGELPLRARLSRLLDPKGVLHGRS